MLSTNHRFLYIHVPKTAGNAVQSVLAPKSDDRIAILAPHQDGRERFELRSDRYSTHKHSTLADYRREYGPAMIAGLFKFTCIRNPWERAVSFWFSPHRGQVEWDREGFVAFLGTIAPLAAFLSPDAAAPLPLPSCIGNVDLVMRYETLEADFSEACRRVGIAPQALPVRNRSARRPYREYYDADLVEKVREHFHEEIAYFGYRF